ncbi:unnamed protein product [Rotaria sordida]|uniref:Uncharacterized protein n=1 Tax=Rotaria sordida TaxID=392033 RepID=A0A819G6N8_9BILA|nr:unnamed protein product [Rotaria sordida]CAF3878171.1 unnamed protein product [Rotaria sordida]
MQLNRINTQMNISRQKDDYIEMELIEWKSKLETLKESLTILPPSIKVRENRSISLVLMIDVDAYFRTIKDEVTETFDITRGDIQITENGLVATHGNSNTHATVRGTCKYLSGKHQVWINIEKLTTKWMFFAIISSKEGMQEKVHDSTSIHGWNGHCQIGAAGETVKSTSYDDYD